MKSVRLVVGLNKYKLTSRKRRKAVIFYWIGGGGVLILVPFLPSCLFPLPFYRKTPYSQDERVVMTMRLSLRIRIHSVVRKINVLAFSIRLSTTYLTLLHIFISSTPQLGGLLL